MITARIIARMEARGWKWSEKHESFDAGGGVATAFGGVSGPVIFGRIEQDMHGTWRMFHGAGGHTWATAGRYSTPEAAADEAEAWFRQVVSGLPGVRA